MLFCVLEFGGEKGKESEDDRMSIKERGRVYEIDAYTSTRIPRRLAIRTSRSYHRPAFQLVSRDGGAVSCIADSRSNCLMLTYVNR